MRILRPRSADALLDDATHAGAERAPYWAELWPSARALATLLAARDLSGLRAVEIGCGLGLASVGAALGGAEVLATDHEPDALAFAAENGRRALGHRLETMEADFGDPPASCSRARRSNWPSRRTCSTSRPPPTRWRRSSRACSARAARR